MGTSAARKLKFDGSAHTETSAVPSLPKTPTPKPVDPLAAGLELAARLCEKSAGINQRMHVDSGISTWKHYAEAATSCAWIIRREIEDRAAELARQARREKVKARR